MRLTICRHGVGPRAARRAPPPARITASSAPVTHGCCSGVSLNDTSQTAVHARLAAPRT